MLKKKYVLLITLIILFSVTSICWYVWDLTSAAEKEIDNTEEIIETVKSYVDKHRDDDPLIEVEQYIWIKQSNLEGITIGQTTYYYSLAPHMSFDPLALEKVHLDDVQIIYKEDAQIPLVIYTFES